MNIIILNIIQLFIILNITYSQFVFIKPIMDDNKLENSHIKKAYYSGGCFWGVEFLFEKLDGVISANSGYMGGKLDNPTYEDVCYRNSGHLEAVEIIYDINKINYEELTKYFFEIHDPTQSNGQGPDIGSQYLSAIFIQNDNEKEICLKLIEILKNKKYNIVTMLKYYNKFWIAEDYHQNYYNKNNKIPYCHIYKKKF